MSALLAAWLYTHPRTRRVWLMAQLIWGGSLLAVMTAPTASAAGIGAALSWTGLHDSYGLPIGAHFVSVVPMTEAVRAQGPDFGASPDTWGPAVMSKVGTALTYTQLSGWLGLECAWLACIAAIGIWFIKFALSAIWLTWLAALAQPILVSMKALVDWMHLIPASFMICATIGGIVAVTAGYGTGFGIILGGFLVIALGAVLLKNPAQDITGENGVLGIGRNLGLTVAQGIANNGPVSPDGSASQLDTITSWLVDVLVRQPIQLINFGQVIDEVPGCAGVYNSALLSGDSSAPAHAMATCAPGALEYARQLDAVAVGLFLFLIAAILVVLFAIDYVGCEVIRTGFRAFWNVLVIVPAAAVAVAPGPQRQFAKRTALKLVVHGVEMLFATIGLGVLVLILMHITRGDLPGLIGMTHPMAKIMVMLIVGVFGAIGFRQLLHAFGDRGMPGPIRSAQFVVRNVSRTTSLAREGEYAGRKISDLRSRAAERRKARQAQNGNDANKGPKPPGRKGHPPTTPSRPPSAPSQASATRPGTPGPGRENRVNGANAPAPTRQPQAQPAGVGSSSPTAGPGRAGSFVANTASAAKTGAKVAGPEGAAAAAAFTAAQHGASRLRGRGSAQLGQSGAPGRSGQPPQADPPPGTQPAERPGIDRPSTPRRQTDPPARGSNGPASTQ